MVVYFFLRVHSSSTGLGLATSPLSSRPCRLRRPTRLEFTMLKCVEGWTYHYSSDKMNWQNARKWCQDHYTDMVAIQNQEENVYLNEVIPFVSGYYWIGIRKINETWTWVGTNQTLSGEAENWAENEPNNGKTTEDCVEIYIQRAKDSGKWNDEPCKKEKTALCYTAACHASSCSGHGACIETINNYTCKCHEGFYGLKCENVVDCATMEKPQKGFMDCSHPFGLFSYNSACDFSCEAGYKLNGSDRVQCTASKEWTSQSPVCEALGCNTLTAPQNGDMVCSHPIGNFSFKSTCEFNCEEGYSLAGSSKLACTSSGKWDEDQPQCGAVKCHTLEAPQNGSMNCSDFRYNSSCQFSCAEGFDLKGAESLTCRASGHWTGEPPQCEAIKCESPKTVAHGVLNCTHPIESLVYNSTCQLSCEEGFVLNTTGSLQCTASGKWSAETPTCKAVACSSLTQPDHGNMVCSPPTGEFSYNSSCKFTCEDGFTLTGADRLQCTASGQWKGQSPKCEAVKCHTLEAPQNGSMNCSDFRYNSSCQFSCAEGFDLKGAKSLTCRASGQWTGEPPQCEAIKCESPKTVAHGVLNCTHPIESLVYNSTCQLSCEEGFVLNTTGSLQCTASGKWSAETPTCKAVACSSLTQPDHGNMVCSSPTGEFSYNSSCKFTCEDGFTLTGADRLQCTASGQWKGQTPKCEAVKCHTLEAPQNGSMNCSDFRYNSSCQFSCAEGFDLKGAESLTCRASGQWTGEPPQCEAIKCESPKTVAHGVLNCTHPIESLVYNSTCQLSCEEGFVLNTTGSLQCTASGKWSAETATCKAVTCNPLTVKKDFMNCSHPFEHFGYKSKCSFYCPEGHLSGSSSLECNSSGKWTAEIPICKEEFTMLGFVEGWTYHSATHQMQWENARQWCQNHYTDMVAIQNQKEIDYLNKVFPRVKGYYWIGIRKLNGTWIWVGTNKTLSQEAENWAKEFTMLGFVEGWTYHSATHQMQWENARQWCQNHYTDMVAIQNQKEIDYLNKVFPRVKGYYWIGIRKLNGTWIWVGTNKTLSQEAENWAKAVKCDTLSEPDHSIITCSDRYGSFSYNSTCQFHCSEGFALNGSSMVTCNSSGHWTEPLPTCTAVKCDTLSEPDHSIITCSDRYGSFSYNSTCQFHCSEGFALNGSSMVTCNSSGHWTEPLPTCTAVKCDTLSEPDHNIITCSDRYGSFSYNSTCQFHCSEGFALNGSSMVTCNSSGHWTEPIPTCTGVKFEDPSKPSQIIINPDKFANVSFNSTCTSACLEGVKFEDPSKPSQIIINPDKFANVSFNSTCTSACLEEILSGKGGVKAWTYHYNITPNMNWDTARQWCRDHFTDMVAIQNQKEIKYLNDVLPSNPNYYWIGIRKINDRWTWVGTNKTLKKEAENWAPGEPNNKGRAQDCVEIYIKRSSHASKWNDERCTRQKGALCFQEILSGKGGVKAWTYHYNITPNMNWDTARQWCRDHFTDMVAIQNQKEIKYLNDVLPSNPNYYWIGIRKINDRWTWVGTNKTLKKEAENWAPGEPNNKGRAQDCVEIYIKRSSHASKWNDERCTRQKGALCFQGFVMAGSGLLQCRASGQWTTDSPTCQVVKCEALSIPSHGSMDCAHPFEKFSYNSGCWFGCEEGFLLNGTNSTQCTSQGRWSAQTPVCQALKCESLKTPIRGVMNCSHPFGDYRYNSSCEMGCEEGFIMRGSDILQCNASGLWTEPLPTCQAVKCEALSIPSHGSMDCAHPIEKFSYNSGCWFGCEEGFLLNGTNSTQCTSQGRWSAQTPVCQALKCESLKTPIRGVMNCSHPFGDYRYNSSCEMGCEEGFIMRGSDILQCNASGLWTEPLPICQVVECPPLPISSAVEMNCSHPIGYFSFLSSCYFNCAEGSKLNGTNRLHCTSDGQWTGTVPSCAAVKCEALSIPSHGSMDCAHPIEKFSYNSGCWFGCEKGFLLNGTNSTQCTSQGRWSAQTPVCQALKCESLKTPIRGVMNCSHPFGDYRYNSSCEMGCEEGFIMRGSDILQCNASGLWTEPLPICQVVECPPLPISSAVEMNCSHPIGYFSFLSSCYFNCAEGSKLNGTNRLHCTSDGQWTGTVPSCAAQVMSTGMALLLYTGVGSGAAVLLLLLGGFVFLIVKRLARQSKEISIVMCVILYLFEPLQSSNCMLFFGQTIIHFYVSDLLIH
ncbi:UNVERIFIED_CONTAM: hypothetical protein FKN15_053815 [Acipenser sinensis]